MSSVNFFNRSLIQGLNRDIFTPLSKVQPKERIVSQLIQSEGDSKVIFHNGTLDFLRRATEEKLPVNVRLVYINQVIIKSVQDILNQLNANPSTEEDRKILADLNTTLKTAITGMKTLHDTLFDDKKDETATAIECAKLMATRKIVETLTKRLDNAVNRLSLKEEVVATPELDDLFGGPADLTEGVLEFTPIEEVVDEEVEAPNLFTELEEKNFAEMSREEIEAFINEAGVDLDNVRGSFYEICGSQKWEGDWVDAHFTHPDYIANWKEAISVQFS